MSISFTLLLPRQLYTEMVEQARAEFPNECCGLLAGVFEERDGTRVGLVRRRLPLVNDRSSPTRYNAEPRGLFAAHRTIGAAGLELLAIYHSHPTSAPIPSRTDLELNNHPEAVHLIISLQSTLPEMRGWWLEEQRYDEADWRLID